jgi:uncharacterized DUF497 family protein
MDIVFQFQDVEFEWDQEKARANVEKHGIMFEEAAEAFFDPFYQEGASTSETQELRNFVLGYSLSQRLLLVIYAERRERIRLISARPATRLERKLYERE